MERIFDSAKVLSNGKTVTQNTVASPLFDFTTTYVQGGVNVGTTRYIDAYQRANFWGTVSSNQGYHVLLNPVVLAEQILSPPKRQGSVGKPCGSHVGEVNLNWIDSQIIALIKTLGSQAYIYTTYVDYPGEFAQDVSALSHEIGVYVDDPLIANASANQTPCGILETLPYFGAPTSTSVDGFFTFQGEALTVCQNGS